GRGAAPWAGGGRAGGPARARLLELRLPWGEPLFRGVRDFFLRHSSPGHPPEDSWRCLGMAARLLGEREDEVDALLERPEEPAETGVGQAVEERYQVGLSLLRHGEFQRAAAQFTAALKLEPGNALVYWQRGEAYRLLCEDERAVADLNRALRPSPSAPAVLVSRAVAYHHGGEHDRAVADCTSALALDPEDAEAYRTRAAAYAELGDPDRALADLAEAIALAPEDDQAPYLR